MLKLYIILKYIYYLKYILFKIYIDTLINTLINMPDTEILKTITDETVKLQLTTALEDISKQHSIPLQDLEQLMYEQLATHNLEQKPKKKTNIIMPVNRCCAEVAAGRQCKRAKKDGTNYCKLHQKKRYNDFDPSEIKDKEKLSETKKTDKNILEGRIIDLDIDGENRKFIYNSDLGGILFNYDLYNPTLYGLLKANGEIIKFDPSLIADD